MKSKSKLHSFLFLSGSSLLAVSTLHAVPLTWDPGSDGTTDGAGAWLGTGLWWDGTTNVDWTSGDSATFGNSGAGGAVTLASPTTAQSITFNSFTGTYTLGTSGQAIILNGGITKNAGSAAATFVSPIILGGAQTWTNNSAGQLLTGNGTNLIDNGGFQLTVDGIGNTTFGVLNNSAVTLSGTGALVKSGTGILSTGGDNSAIFSGAVTLNGGILFYGDFPGSLGTGNILITNGVLESRWSTGITRTQGTGAGQIQITGGESGFALNGNTGVTFNIGAITWGSATFNPTKFLLQTARSQSNSNITLPSTIDLNGADRTIVVSGGTTGAARAILSGAISNGTGTGGLIKEGSGRLNITNNSSAWNGNTTVSGGILDLGGVNLANIGGGSGRNIAVAADAGVRFNNVSNAILNRIVETTDEIIVQTGTTSNPLDFSSSTGATLPNAFLSNWASNGAKTELSGVITPGGGAYRLGSVGQSGALGIRKESLLSGSNQLIVGGNRVVIVGAHTFTGDTTIRNGGRLGLSAAGTVDEPNTNSLALQNSVLDLGAPGATGQFFLEASTTAGPIAGSNPSSVGGTQSATFGGLKGSRNLYAAYVAGNTGNNTSGAAQTSITGFTLNVGTGNTVTYSGIIGGFGAGAVSGTGGAMTLTKSGEGTQVFEGIHTYTGATTIEGGILRITNPYLDDASDVIISASAQLDLQFDESGGDVTDTVETLTIGGVQQAAGIYGATGSGATTIDDVHFAGVGTLTVTSGPGGGSAYDTWAAGPFDATLTDPSPSLDFDNGGLDTGIEWVVGGDPTDGSDDAGNTPTVSEDGTYLVFTYNRTDAANDDPNTEIKVEYGSDLTGWTPAENAVSGVIINETPGSASDVVEVKIPMSLAVGDKLFARLNVVVTP